MKCISCKHYLEQFMECRRNPPYAGVNRKGVFPIVTNDTWCGEYAEKLIVEPVIAKPELKKEVIDNGNKVRLRKKS